jgi:hypothetical protein
LVPYVCAATRTASLSLQASAIGMALPIAFEADIGLFAQ